MYGCARHTAFRATRCLSAGIGPKQAAFLHALELLAFELCDQEVCNLRQPPAPQYVCDIHVAATVGQPV